MESVDESRSNTAAPGRELAVRALLAGPDCSQQRISDLLGVSRRTIGRMAEADLTTAVRDPHVVAAPRRASAGRVPAAGAIRDRSASCRAVQASSGD